MENTKALEEKFPGVVFRGEIEIGENVSIAGECVLSGNVKISDGVTIERGNVLIDVTIGENCYFYANSRAERSSFGSRCEVYPNNFVRDSSFGEECVLYPNNFADKLTMGKGSSLSFSHAENAVVGEGVSVGPYARLRPEAKIGKNAKIGNFVEIKNSVVGEGSKVSHLAYVGDCDMGRECNIGCGAIFVNYDGKNKHRSVVGDDCFIGSNCNVIAPVNLAEGSYVCAGTTVTEDTEQGDFVIGRSRQENKKGKGRRYR